MSITATPTTTTTSAHTFGAYFDRAVDTAREGLSVKASIVAPEYLDGYKIVRRHNHNGTASFHVYDEDAWDHPSENPLLLWSAPVGEVVATMATDGSLTFA